MTSKGSEFKAKAVDKIKGAVSKVRDWAKKVTTPKQQEEKIEKELKVKPGSYADRYAKAMKAYKGKYETEATEKTPKAEVKAEATEKTPKAEVKAKATEETPKAEVKAKATEETPKAKATEKTSKKVQGMGTVYYGERNRPNDLQRMLDTYEERLQSIKSRPGYSDDEVKKLEKKISDLKGKLSVKEAISDLAVLLVKTNISESNFVDIMSLLASANTLKNRKDIFKSILSEKLCK